MQRRMRWDDSSGLLLELWLVTEHYIASHLRRPRLEFSPPWKPQISHPDEKIMIKDDKNFEGDGTRLSEGIIMTISWKEWRYSWKSSVRMSINPRWCAGIRWFKVSRHVQFCYDHLFIFSLFLDSCGNAFLMATESFSKSDRQIWQKKLLFAKEKKCQSKALHQ